MCEDRFPINARMNDYNWEEHNMWRLVTNDLLVDFRLVKSVDVRKRELLVKTEEKNANVLAEAQRLRCIINDYDLSPLTVCMTVCPKFSIFFWRNQV